MIFSCMVKYQTNLQGLLDLLLFTFTSQEK